MTAFPLSKQRSEFFVLKLKILNLKINENGIFLLLSEYYQTLLKRVFSLSLYSFYFGRGGGILLLLGCNKVRL